MINESSATTAKQYKELIAVLGKNNVGNKIESPFDFIHIANKGVNATVVEKFRNYFNVSVDDTAHMLNVSAPTIYRWIKTKKNLNRNSSVILFELTELFLYGSDVFESKDAFMKWLNLPNTALGGLEPQDLLEVPGGISKVRDVIGRIEYGVYS